MEQNAFMVPNFAPVEQRLHGFDGMLRKGHIILKPVRSKKSTNNTELNNNILSFRGWKNGETDVWYGIPVGRNADGTYKFKRIIIEGHRHYNLEVEQDAKEWHMVQHHPSICNDGKLLRRHFFEVVDTERDAQVKIVNTDLAVRAIEIINGADMNETKIRDIARLFAIDTINNSYVVVKQLLYEKALNKPDYFMSIMDNTEERDIRVVIQRGMATGLVQLTPDKGYMFKNSIPLGPTEGAIITALRKDRQMLIHIDLESKGLDKFYKTEEAEKKVSVPASNGKAPEKATVAGAFEKK